MPILRTPPDLAPPAAASAPALNPDPVGWSDDAAPAGVVSLTAQLVRHRRLLLLLPAVLAAATAVYTLRTPREYASVTSLFVQQRQGGGVASGLASVASQFGVNLGAPAGEGSPEFLETLVRSRRVLERLAAEPLDSAAGAPTLAARLGEELGRPLTPQGAASYLRSHVETDVDLKTGVTQVTVRAPSAQTASAVAGRLLEATNRFHIESRQQRASGERRFAASRLAAAQQELADAERRYAAFLAGNREFRGAPDLLLREDQLRRDVSVKQGLVSTLTQALEQARIDELRDSPVVSALEPPSVPDQPVGRGLALRVLLAIVLGEFFALLIVLGRALAAELVSPRVTGSAVLRTELRAARRDLSRPWRLLLPRGAGAARAEP